MKHMNYKWFLGIAAVSMAYMSQAQTGDMPAILADPEVAATNPLPDFSYAGYGFGTEPIPDVSAVIDVAEYGAVPDDGKDDSAALKAALSAAHDATGPIRVQMHAGRYQLTEILWIERSGIVLSGMGMAEGGTELYMPRPLNQIDDGGALTEIREYLEEEDKYERQKDQNLDVLFSEYSWSGGFIWARYPGGRHATYLERYDRPIERIADIAAGEQFERVLTLRDTSGLAVGDVLQIHWHNRAGPEGALVKSLYGDTEERIGSRHWEMPDRPLVRQATRIEAIDGDQVTIADPLLHDIGETLPAYFASWDHLTDVGLQDFAMVFPDNPEFGHHNEAGFNGVYFTGVHNGWIRNLRIAESDSGILTDDLANVTISNIVTEGDHTAHYSVHIGNVHNVLVTGNEVFNPTVHTFSFNTQATRSVYHRSTGWEQPTLDQHAGANHQNLYDDMTVYIRPTAASENDPASYDLFKAGGAGYWVPGHGRYNTVWNLNILVGKSAGPNEPVLVTELSGGPDARTVGVHGNRPLEWRYSPDPYSESMGSRILAVPSLYDWQLLARSRN